MSASPPPRPEAPIPYDGWEFESLSGARRYYRWISDLFEPFLAGRVLEIGAGAGNFTRSLLAAHGVSTLTCLEPSPRHAAGLSPMLEGAGIPCRVLPETLEAWLGRSSGETFDSAVMINVLEHIGEDREVIRGLAEHIVPGGFLCLMVPAHASLYGSMDRVFGHLRRYDRKSLGLLAGGSGFRIVRMHPLNMVGALAWFLMGRVLRKRSWSGGSVAAWDRLVVPAVRLCESLVRPPFGQSLLVVLEKE